jgi:nucleoside-diphosphate-sugar epimerase
MLLVIGKNGIIAQEVQIAFSDEPLVVVGRESTKTWSSEVGATDIEAYVEGMPSKPERIINCAGITDPRRPEKELIETNFILPRNLLQYSVMHNVPIVTFGSIMESIPELCNSNAYLKSKTLYFQHFKEVDKPKVGNIHLQLNTLYGGKKYHPHMFLGQLIESIKKDVEFKMSNGSQIREYHHVKDDVQALVDLINSAHSGIIAINHNERIAIRKIAEYVFSELDKSHLLRIGELPSPEIEQYFYDKARIENPQDFVFRETLPGILEFVREVLGEKT